MGNEISEFTTPGEIKAAVDTPEPENITELARFGDSVCYASVLLQRENRLIVFGYELSSTDKTQGYRIALPLSDHREIVEEAFDWARTVKTPEAFRVARGILECLGKGFFGQPAWCLEYANPFTIPARCYSDDRAAEVEFDALPWFEQASLKDIEALAECDFGGDYPADAVASFVAETGHGEATKRLRDLFAYLAARNTVAGNVIGFECHVESYAAKKWLLENVQPH